MIALLFLACSDETTPVGTDPTEPAGTTTDTTDTLVTDPPEPPDTDGPTTPPTTVPPPPAVTYDAELASVCINELMASNAIAYESGGLYPDWVELHNSGATDVDLTGWGLSDNVDEPFKFLFPSGSILVAGTFQVFLADSTPDVGPTHLPFSLKAEGDDLGLFAPNGDGEVIAFGPLTDDVAAARSVDCGPDTWTTVWLGTPGASNVAE